ncbi:MAG: hypothetical protein ACLPUO_04525 [Streptosporangiaceae bacterium]|jgi:hypothetical protein
MRRVTGGLLLLAALFLTPVAVAACGASGAAANAIASLSPRASGSIAPDPTISPSLPATPTATVTVTPSSSASTASSPPVSPSATPSASHSAAPATSFTAGDIWPFVAIGAILIIGLVVWVFRAEGRRGAAAAAWRSRVVDAYARGSALYDAMSTAETPAAFAAPDAGRRWYEIQRRADDFAQMLYALREAAPDDNGRARVTDVLAALQAVRAAMDAERAPGAAGQRQAEHVRARLFSFEAALRALRESDQLLA